MTIVARNRPPPRRRANSGRAGYYAVAALLAFLFVLPIAWSLLNALKTPEESVASPPVLVPSALTLGNFAALVNYGPGVGRSILNSVAVAAMTILGTSALSVLAGYGFARFRFPLQSVIFIVILAALMIPFQTILTPLFLVLSRLHLNNTLFGLAVVYTTFQLPFSIFLMRNSFESVPREIEEAALLDGCNSLGLLGRVMLPLVLPGIITVVLFSFFGSWNEFIAALIFQSDVEHFTLPVMLLSAQSGTYGTVNWGMIQAGLAFSMLPCLLLFILLQRYYLSGLTAGAVKS